MNNSNLENQWSAYASSSSLSKNARPAIVGGMLAATGAAVFSLPTHASAAIITGAVNQTITWNNTGGAPGSMSIFLALSAPALKFQGYYIKNATLQAPQVGSGPVGGAKAVIGQFVTNGLGSHGLKKFAFGQSITVGANFKNVSSQAGPFGAPLNVKSGTANLGSFGLNKTYFAAFELTNGDLGYIELSVNNDGTNPTFPDEFTILQFGYNNTSGASITAGETSPVPEASNTATALLLLACAGGTLATWRRNKQAVQVPAPAVA